MDIYKILSELTLEEKAGLCSGRDFWHTKAVERLGVPSVMMCDGPHGLRKQKGEGDHLGINESIESVCYPTASALASSFDRKLLEKLGHVLGQECQAENVAMLLGPGLNMKRSPLCGRNFEYLSEDSYLAGELAASYIQALQAEGVAACVKHFAANNQETRRMSGSSQVDERTLYETYLPAFETAVKKGGTRSVMCAYNAINGTYCAENKELLSDILRNQWGYKGFVVTDWGAVKDRVNGLLAGLDLEMPGGPGSQDIKIVEAVKNGTLKEEVLDHAVLNVLKFVSEYQMAHRDDITVDREANSNLSGELAAQCAVLLKNVAVGGQTNDTLNSSCADNKVLPIKKGRKTAFIGEFARNPRYQGAGSSHINVPHVVGALETVNSGLLDGISGSVVYAKGYDLHTDEINANLQEEAVRIASESEAAVIFAGLPDAFETEGVDRKSMEMPASQNALIEAVAAVQPNTVVVLHCGAPVEMPWLAKVPAVLCMYLGGERVGEATVKLLYGEAVPQGKLAETWPVKLEDNPSILNFPGEDGIVEYREGIFIGYRYYDRKKMEVNFPFGHGLSYTEFGYSDLRLDKESMYDTEKLTVSCMVKNKGKTAGREVIQLYVGNAKETAIRPDKELKGFEKVELQPGEEKTVTFILDKRAFAYYERNIHDWIAESGDYQILIGSSSRDIRLHAVIHVNSTTQLPIHYTRQSTVGDLMKTASGRAMVQQMMQDGGQGQPQDRASENVKNMGEGSERMMQAMMMEMPLNSLVSFGAVTWEQLDGMLFMLNAGQNHIGQ